jgi:hypothetical protein
MDLAVNKDTTFAQFACLVECLSRYLQNERFQNACVQHGLVEKLLSVLRHSYDIKDVDESSSEDVKLLAQTQLKLNQTISDVSAVSEFAEVYPIGSSLFNSLKSWMAEPEDQLQICACVILGNLARSDEVCRLMISELDIHRSLIAMLKQNNNARGSVMHAALGFLKNLAILEENRGKLGEADIIPTVSHLWTSDTIPQVQLAAVSLIRLVINSSVENIGRLLAPLSPDPDSPAHLRTYLSLLLSLLGRTDSTPIKTEIGRIVASICRTLGSQSREGNNEEATALFDRLFDLHEDVARPVDTMVTQTEWPVVRSEGWFALALMASHTKGSLAVADRLYNTDVYQLVEETLEGDVSGTDNASIQMTKDRENLVVMIKELLDNDVSSVI